MNSRFGFWAAVSTAVLTVVSFGIAILTPPRSGASCAFDACVTYPYTEIGDFFPRDYYWMIPATLVVFAFVALMSSVHYRAGAERRPFTLIGLAFASMAATLLSIDYFIQLTVIQPSVLRGETDGLSLYSQYNPHGIFIDLEALGYSLISVAVLTIASAFTNTRGIARALRWVCLGTFALTILALILTYAMYGTDVEYRFEIFVILINWTALIVVGVLLSILFRREIRDDENRREP